MTTEEKLKHFQDICMEDARDRSAKMLDDYMAALEKSSRSTPLMPNGALTCRWRWRLKSWSAR